jgi:colanic acid biosynthesis glycosyl transferase WcaI
MPVLPKENAFSEANGIASSINLIYAGTLGMKQNPSVLVDLALSFRDRTDFCIVVVANGSGISFLQSQIQEQKLRNINILPLQPFEVLPEVLASGDLLIAMLEPDASAYCVPSKILTYYCAGKPSLLVMSKDNLAARTTLDHELGFVIEPHDSEGLKSIVSELLENPGAMIGYGERARNYAELNFPIEKVANRFIEIINRLKS